MAENLKNLNKALRKKKAKKKVAKKVASEPDIVDRLVDAIEGIQAPQVIVEARKPTSYKVTVDINSRGDMIGATINPVTE
jgi:hypothetical protein